MSGHYHLDDSVVSESRGRPVHLVVPEYKARQSHSPRGRRPLRSALSPPPDPNRYDKKRKHVHWASEVVDNEHKMMARQHKLKPVVQLKKSPDKSIELPKLLEPLMAIVPADSHPSFDQSQLDYSFIQSFHPDASPSSVRPRAPYQRSVAGDFVSSKSPRPISSSNFHNIPPAVPDAPGTCPPPPPRPARLPTPDLPEIEESKLFLPMDKIVIKILEKSDPEKNPVHSKTEIQMDEAMAYIQERKRRGC